MGNSGKSLALVIAIFFLSSSTIAFQPVKADSEVQNIQWSKTYGPYFGYAVTQTIDGGHAIAGQNATLRVHGYNNYEPLIIKTDLSGQLQWRTVIPIGGYAVSIVQTKDLGYAIGCQPNGVFVKLDSQGNIEWNKDFGLKSCHVIQDSDGNFILGGYKNNNYNGENAILIKTDESGNLIWNKTFGEISFRLIEINAVMQTNDKSYLLAGNWNSSAWFAKVDSSGNLQWSKTYRLSAVDNSFASIANTSDGSYILGGFDQNGGLLTKIDSQGTFQWSHPFPAGGNFAAVAQTLDGGYIAAGDTRLLKMDSAGNLQWNATSELDGTPWSLALTNDGGYVVTGFKSSTDGTQSVWLVVFAPYSNVSSTPSIPEFPPIEILPFLIVVLSIAVVLKLSELSRTRTLVNKL